MIDLRVGTNDGSEGRTRAGWQRGGCSIGDRMQRRMILEVCIISGRGQGWHWRLIDDVVLEFKKVRAFKKQNYLKYCLLTFSRRDSSNLT